MLNNALKYSQPHTRVYIDFKKQQAEKGDLIIMEMKNVSRQSLNIDPSELMERFKRGDESRTTEGSGLGLAIAKDLMKLMDGWIELSIDGDLFKVKVMLSAAAADEPIVTPDGMEMDSMKAAEQENPEEDESGMSQEPEPMNPPDESDQGTEGSEHSEEGEENPDDGKTEL